MNSHTKNLYSSIDERIHILTKLKDSFFHKTLEKIIITLGNNIKNNSPVLIFGNGGSAADSEHFATEMLGKFLKKRSPVNFIPLTSNTSFITAHSNDYDFSDIFSRQIKAFSNSKKITCIALTTSGKSKNIIKGLSQSKLQKFKTITFCGQYVNNIKKYSDFILSVPSSSTPVIQEVHKFLFHYICQKLEEKI